MFFREAASFLVRNDESFLFAVIGGGDFGARLVGKGNTIKISVVFFDFGVGGAEGFAPRENIESLKNRGFAETVGAKDKRGFRITI